MRARLCYKGRICLMGALTLWAGVATRAGDDDIKFFESQVRPLLIDNCVKCHGPSQQKGGLRLDDRSSALAGGNSGPAIDPGHPEQSLIVDAIHHDGLEMPPKKRLRDDQIQIIERWIERGAPWPEEAPHGKATMPGLRTGRAGITEADRAWWAIQPLRPPVVPVAPGDTWSRNPIDAFVLTRLRQDGLSPAPEADRRTLIRRVSVDLVGLPPSPEEIAAFERDTRPDAYERLVDRLLESPRYGERWARHWLDLVRYAESDGYKADAYRPEVWRYRDYVIDALNTDLPYDRFVAEQLAGDELDPTDVRLRVATSFLRLWPYEYNQRDVEGQWSAILNDMTDITGDVFLGVGLSCARCHDHKFDPILQTDYYRIQAFFTPMMPRDDLPLAGDIEVKDKLVSDAAWHLMTADLRERIDRIEAPHKANARADAIAKFQPHLQAIITKDPSQRTPREQQLMYFMQRQLVEEFGNISGRIKGKEKAEYDALVKELRAFDAFRSPPVAHAMNATDVPGEAPPTLIPGRRKPTEVTPGFLAILDEGSADPATSDVPPQARRLALSRWLTRPDHPLTTRVIVNRLWQYHFGRGLVATSSDFGNLGEPPTHGALLDWLARELVSRGWSLKSIHRLILTSAAYRQGRQADNGLATSAQRIDPDNRLLWERRPRRLDAECLRDAMLAAGDELHQEILGGPAVETRVGRRTIYTRQVRNHPDPLLSAFDAPDGAASTPQRDVTTTATQALDLFNGGWSIARGEAFASRLQRECPKDLKAQINRGYQIALGRAPTGGEHSAALAFIEEQTCRAASSDDSQARYQALCDFCHTLLNSSAFVYVE